VSKLPFYILWKQFEHFFFCQTELNAELELINLDRDEHFKQLKAELEQFKQQNQDLSENLNQKSKENGCQLSSIEKLEQQLEQCKAEIADNEAKHVQAVLDLNETNEAIINELQKKLNENIAALEAEKLKDDVAVQRFNEQIKTKDQEIAENKENIQQLEKELANARELTHGICVPETESQVAGSSHKRELMHNSRRSSTETDFESIDGRSQFEPVSKKNKTLSSALFVNESKV
jgi:chromosome segregation ATPase